MKLTLIGNGVMAEALALGLVSKYEIEVLGRNEQNLAKLKTKIPQIETKLLGSNANIDDKNIIFCVKPYAFESVCAGLEGEANTVYSILAGTSLYEIRKQIEAKNYVRTMPNIAAQTGNSMTSLVGDEAVRNEALDIFSSIGNVLWLNTEKQLDIASAIAGSGPAFLALIAEGLTDGGVNAGLERSHCASLVEGLFASFSSLIAKYHPTIIKDKVTSPGGTSIAGVTALEDHKVRAAMINAVNLTYEKTKIISQH